MKIRIGIIGSGFGLYGLLPAFNSINNCQVICICGKKTERLSSYCESIGLTKIYPDWEQMLALENLDVIAIAVTPRAQYNIAEKAIQKGLHVFAEKPLTTNYKEAKKLLLLAKKNKITTAVDFIFPEIDEWQKAKDLLDSKKYGKLEHISVDWNFLSYDIKNKITSWKTDVKEGGGALSFYVSHVLYYLEYYGGKIKKIKSLLSYSDKSKNGGEVGVSLDINFKDNVTGQVNFSCNSPCLNNHKVIFVCEKAKIILENNTNVTDSFELTVCTSEGSKNISVRKSGIVKKDEDERVKIVRKLATRFIAACNSRRQMTPSFSEGVRVQELIDIIRREQ